MRSLVVGVVRASVVLALAAACADDTVPPSPIRAKGDAARAAPRKNAVAEFGGRLYGAASFGEEKNFVVSPFATFESLAMLEVGARGTSSEALVKLVGSGSELAPWLTTLRDLATPKVFSMQCAVQDNSGYGVKVAEAPPENTPAVKAGLRKGDLIFTINDDPVRSVEEFDKACLKVGRRGTISGYDLALGTVFENRAVELVPIPDTKAKLEDRPMAFARGVWIVPNLATRSAYPGRIEQLFEARTFPLDVTLEVRASQYFSRETGGRIAKVAFPPLDRNTKLLLVNVLAMNAFWKHPFNPPSTVAGDFDSPTGPVKADFMSQRASFALAELEQVKVLEMPYRDGEYLFRVYLPSKPDGLPALEKQLASPEEFEERIAAALQRESVSVQLPRFRVESAKSLKPALAALGIGEVFQDTANLKGIDETDALKVGDVLQHVFLEVDEYGTRAGAKIAIPAKEKGTLPRVRTFHANHPFAFDVRDSLGTVYLMGRVTHPEPPRPASDKAILDK